jgi:hypothetical protein
MRRKIEYIHHNSAGEILYGFQDFIENLDKVKNTLNSDSIRKEFITLLIENLKSIDVDYFLELDKKAQREHAELKKVNYFFKK